MLAGMVSLAVLSIVTLVVFVEEAVVVSIGRQLGVVELLVIVSDSLDVFGCIGDIWVVGGVVIRGSQVSVDLITLALVLVSVSAVSPVVVALGLEERVGRWGGHRTEISGRHVAKESHNGKVQSSFH